MLRCTTVRQCYDGVSFVLFRSMSTLNFTQSWSLVILILLVSFWYGFALHDLYHHGAKQIPEGKNRFFNL